MPHNKMHMCRNRFDHCSNMVAIAKKYVVSDDSDVKRVIAESCMLHDIGHHRYGHDAEREISRLFPHVQHNNTKQSLRFCHDKEDCVSPLFSSEKIRVPKYLRQKLEAEENAILDSIDQVENCFGDILDLYYGYNQEVATKLIHVFDKNIELSIFKPKDSLRLLERVIASRQDSHETLAKQPVLMHFEYFREEIFEVNKMINSTVRNSNYFKEVSLAAIRRINYECSRIYDTLSVYNLREQDIIDVLTSSLME